MPLTQRVLVAETNANVAARLQRALINDGVLADFVADGVAAIDKLERVHYGVVLIDYMLPIIDGPTLIERVRLFARGERPIVIVTAPVGMPLQLDHEIVQVVVRKPYDRRQLADLICACVRTMAEVTAGRSTSPGDRPEARLT